MSLGAKGGCGCSGIHPTQCSWQITRPNHVRRAFHWFGHWICLKLTQVEHACSPFALQVSQSMILLIQKKTATWSGIAHFAGFPFAVTFGIGGNTVNFNYLGDSTTSGPWAESCIAISKSRPVNGFDQLAVVELINGVQYKTTVCVWFNYHYG